MTKIKSTTDCGNSPKNKLLQELTIALARSDEVRISELVSEDVRWMPVGRQVVEGQAAFKKAIKRYGSATRLTIEHVISHGKAGAVNGVIEFSDKRRAFCFLFDFCNAKGTQVSGITSYSVPLT